MVQRGDVVQFIVPKAKPDRGLVVPVLFEDEHMAVVLKPAGVKIHGRGNTVRVSARVGLALANHSPNPSALSCARSSL